MTSPMYVHGLTENIVPGRRLGRRVNHDPRSRAYRFRAPVGVTLQSVRWSTDDDAVLDQGDIGSCTGNATVGALICSLGSLHKALAPAQVARLDEALAVKVYSRATETDDAPGTYKPDDTGSDGLNAAKAAQSFGFINGYTHAMDGSAALAATQVDPFIIGVIWRTGSDEPATSGRIYPLKGTVRGGHEICVDAYDAVNSRVYIRNSWGDGWGLDGRAWMTAADFVQLLADQGDATLLTPLTAPAPTPTVDPSLQLWQSSQAWLAAPHVGKNAAEVKLVQAWGQAMGYAA